MSGLGNHTIPSPLGLFDHQSDSLCGAERNSLIDTGEFTTLPYVAVLP